MYTLAIILSRKTGTRTSTLVRAVALQLLEAEYRRREAGDRKIREGGWTRLSGLENVTWTRVLVLAFALQMLIVEEA